MRVVLIGGGGLLGRTLSPLLVAAGHDVAVASRSGEVRADLRTGEGIDDAVARADVVVHLASDARSPQEVDVSGTRRLLDALGRQYLVYMSIVGVDRHPFPYYRAKHQAERLIDKSGVRHGILRATQFHDFISYLLGLACRPPVALVPKRWVFQPIATQEVAAALADLVETRRPGLQPDLAGPQTHDVEYLARSYMTRRGRERPILNMPVPGRSGRAFRDGIQTNPDRAVGVQTWDEFLAVAFPARR